jgi:DNA-binding beta-propeller fold protein YncE
MTFKKIAFISIGLVLFASCESDKPDVKPKTPFTSSTGTGVFIINEGNYQWGNSSVSYYKFSDESVNEDIFESVNQRPLGDVGQSMEIFNGKAYVIVNNSGKIEVVDPSDFKSLGSITGLISPRYFLGINSSKAYVTDLFSNSISVINLNSDAKVKEIPCNGWTEELCLVNEKAFVTNLNSSYLYIIDTNTDLMADSILVGYGSNSIKIDKNGKLWVLCGGNGNSIPGTIHRIDPATEQVELSMTFTNTSQSPWKLDINGSRDTLFYLNNGVFNLPITQASLPAQSLIPQSGFLFYGLGVDPASGTIYVSDAIDYVQKGKVFRYKPDGTLINSFKVGISPGEFYFH